MHIINCQSESKRKWLANKAALLGGNLNTCLGLVMPVPKRDIAVICVCFYLNRIRLHSQQHEEGAYIPSLYEALWPVTTTRCMFPAAVWCTSFPYICNTRLLAAVTEAFAVSATNPRSDA